MTRIPPTAEDAEILRRRLRSQIRACEQRNLSAPQTMAALKLMTLDMMEFGTERTR